MQYEEVKELIAIFEKTDLNDMEVQLDNARIRLNRGAVSPWMPVPQVPLPNMAPPMAAQAAALPAVQVPVEGMTETVQAEGVKEAAVEESGQKVITAPIVGTFIRVQHRTRRHL